MWLKPLHARFRHPLGRGGESWKIDRVVVVGDNVNSLDYELISLHPPDLAFPDFYLAGELVGLAHLWYGKGVASTPREYDLS